MATENNQAFAARWVRMEEAPSWEPDELLPGLFIGGTADNDTVDRPRDRRADPATRVFDAVATLYAEAQPAGWGTEELRFGFMDGRLDPATIDRILAVADWVHARWREGRTVLVRCQAGLNRSGLVSALVLMKEGLPAADAIALLRERRSPWALCNDSFVRWLLDDAGDRLGDQPAAA